MDDFSERAAKFFPKSTDWPPPERRRTVSIAEMIAPSSKKKAIRDALQDLSGTGSITEMVAPKKKKDIKVEDVKK
jgi:hypothetical protein